MPASVEDLYAAQRASVLRLYAIAALAAIAQYGLSWQMIAIGCAALGLCAVMVKKLRQPAKNTPYESHIAWISRTLHIGGYYLFPAAVLVALWLVYKFTGISGLQQEIIVEHATTANTLMPLLESYLQKSAGKINLITALSITPPILWWVWRCGRGFIRARGGEPIKTPQGFF